MLSSDEEQQIDEAVKKFSESAMRDVFTTLDSGKRDEFATGAMRDSHEDKPRFDLIPHIPLRRLADLYARGAAKYGPGNWEKGIPFSRVYASLLRHVYAWRSGNRSEDHLAAVAWNAFALMAYEEDLKAGNLPEEVDDLGIFQGEKGEDGHHER